MKRLNFMRPSIESAIRAARKSNAKRMGAFVMAAMISAAAFVPAASAAEAADITISGQGAGYTAYRLMDLTTALKPNCGHEGDEAHSPTCYNYAYTVNPVYLESMQGVLAGKAQDSDGSGALESDELVEYVSSLSDSGEYTIRKFADDMYAQVKDMSDADAGDSKLAVSGKTFSEVPQGYYLIVETANADDPDMTSLVMLDTAGKNNVTVAAKESVPTLEKKIVKGDGNFVDADFVRFGEVVTYQLTATMPAHLTNYDTYKLVFHDDLPEGFEADDVLVELVNGESRTDVTSQFTITTAGLTDGCNLEVSVDNAKELSNIDTTSKVVVTYMCTVPDTALTGTGGNTNTAHLEFSNDPYVSTRTSKTPGDVNRVFTTQLTINKVDDHGEALVGAAFKLQKKEGGNYVDFRDVVSGEVNAENPDGSASFVFKGLDEGDYQIVETKAPDGFMAIDPIEFTVSATVETDSDDPQLTAVTATDPVSANETDKLLRTTVENTPGNKMPGTGGVGVYMIYAGGAVLTAVATTAVVLKKKHHE